MASKQKEVLSLFDIPENRRVSRRKTEQKPAVVYKPLPPGIGKLKRGSLFTVFLKSHREEAQSVIALLLGSKDYNEFMENASRLKSVVNEILYIYCCSVALLRNPQTKNLMIPPIWQTCPYDFFDQKVQNEVASLTQSAEDKSEKKPIEIVLQPTGNNRDPEYKLAYFREDVALNSHHWHWHIVYPSGALPSEIRINRKGELFYYMHQQMLCHYDAHRLSNGLGRVKSLHDYDEIIPEGYYPKLNSTISGLEYAGRQANTRLSDTLNITVEELERFRERIHHSISVGYLIASDGTQKNLQNDEGIDLLGDVIESSNYSMNSLFYGDVHNAGHVMLSVVHDPDKRYNSADGVMGFVQTALRDPVFYRWHKHIDNLFQDHKRTLTSYSDKDLTVDKIQIKEASVTSNKTPDKKNSLLTFFATQQLNLTKGLDFGNIAQSILVTVTHLQHDEFVYNIKVVNDTGKDFTATFRIFMAPKHDELGNVMELNEQRLLMMEMDNFHLKLSTGENNITRKSEDSNVTLHKEMTWEMLENQPNTEEKTPEHYCACGWPHHLLLPKGTALGMVFQCFIMITNWENDKVENSNKTTCESASRYCGILNELYPDKKPMGFPFDKQINSDIKTFTSRSNMTVFDVSIFHK